MMMEIDSLKMDQKKQIISWSCYIEETKVLQPFDCALNMIFERALRHNIRAVPFVRTGLKYVADLKLMIQRRDRDDGVSYAERSIKRHVIQQSEDLPRLYDIIPVEPLIWITEPVVSTLYRKYQIIKEKSIYNDILTRKYNDTSKEYFEFMFASTHFESLLKLTNPESKGSVSGYGVYQVDCLEYDTESYILQEYNRLKQEFSMENKSIDEMFVFHGTDELATDQIIDEGFKIGGVDKGINVKNGCSFGPGVYTGCGPMSAVQYARGQSACNILYYSTYYL